MKRAAFLLFVILSFYIAGLYRYPPLLVLSAAALLSLPILFFLPRYLKRRLFVEPVRKSETTQKEEELECELRGIGESFLSAGLGFTSAPGMEMDRLAEKSREQMEP